MNKFKSGVITGNDVTKLFNYAKQNNFAIPAVNCTNIYMINAVLEAANIMRSPIIIQFSYNGSSFMLGNILNNKFNNILELSILGSIFGANYIHDVSKYYDIPIMIHTDHCQKKMLPWLDGIIKYEIEYFKNKKIILFSSHMIDLSNETIIDNLNISSKYFNILKNMNITLEVELGITGGEEDEINNNDINKKLLYTNPKDVLYMFKNLNKINNNFIIAASFGNMHGVYKQGSVSLDVDILKKSQDLVNKYLNIKKNILNFVFHGGSGTDCNIISKSIEYGVVKFNIDTDIQWASWNGILNFYRKNKQFLQSQLGNNISLFSPNKKYYDPRTWLKESQLSIINELKTKFKLLNSFNSI